MVPECVAHFRHTLLFLDLHYYRPSSGGSMNPVRTLGPAIAAGNYKSIWIYMVAPTLGALGGAGVYTLVKLGAVEGETPRPVRSFRR